MEQLLEKAAKIADQAEVCTVDVDDTEVYFTNGRLHEMDAACLTGVTLRIIKDGKLGFSCTRNPSRVETLLENALASLSGGVEAGYQFPHTRSLPHMETYDPAIEGLTGRQMVDECDRICERLKAMDHAERECWVEACTLNRRILNTAGTDIQSRQSLYATFARLIIPGGDTGMGRRHQAKAFSSMPDTLIEELMSRYKAAMKETKPAGGRMEVIFMPQSAVTLNWRINAALNARVVYNKVSPLTGREGERIFHDSITVCNEPLNDKVPMATAFDDEGTACRNLTLVENGVLKQFFCDLKYAWKLGISPTGNGFKPKEWSSETLGIQPLPAVEHLTFRPGDHSMAELIRSVDRGLLLEGAMGPHSGNIPNGDFSVGGAPALYIENGEIIGRVKDVMVSGNIYETLQNVIALEDTVHPCWGGRMPAILCGDVSVAVKS